ncbi:MAG: hypothetical protein IT359_07730 [Gemmatimonadaceae bacterium]|nr:hypothetical protein [Gemmatimonadaceae bacterium]
MSRKGKPARPSAPSAATGGPAGAPSSAPLSARRRRIFLAVTVLAPFLCLAGVEGALRLLRPEDALPLFVPALIGDGALLVANPRIGERYFPTASAAPAPPAEFFARDKPANGFRLFVMGESTTAGFPYPRNGTFSRLLRDALHDVLPADSVEVINLGIAATNSVTLRDLAGEVAAQRPDAVLIYAGHNEYYGVMGAASRSGGGAPWLARASLAIQRFRLGMALRRLLSRGGAAAADSAPSFMEVLARDREVPEGSPTYARGREQFADNLAAVLSTFRAAGIPVFVGSLASNVRDQAPFASPANGAADSAYRAGHEALERGDSAAARTALPRARDLDVVRFRAPGAFTATVQSAARAGGATYVPVAERFEQASGGLPGGGLFLEHVHPTRAGVTLLARAFFEALDSASFLGHRADRTRFRGWDAYQRGAALTPFDERIAHHTVQTIVGRWPFVPAARQVDYRATYRPASLLDSLALMVSRGGVRWEEAKLRIAEAYRRRAFPDSAAWEYRGLVRDQPVAEFPRRLLAGALQQEGRTAEAEQALRQALQLEPSSAGALALAQLLLQRKDVPAAIPLLEQAVRIEPTNTAALYQLSLAYGLARDLERSRATALTLARIDPRYPGLAGWMAAIGLAR